MLSPASTERVTLSKNSRRLVRQDLPLLKPCCESYQVVFYHMAYITSVTPNRTVRNATKHRILLNTAGLTAPVLYKPGWRSMARTTEQLPVSTLKVRVSSRLHIVICDAFVLTLSTTAAVLSSYCFVTYTASCIIY